MRCCCGYLSGARCRLFAYGPADAIASQNPVISCLSCLKRLVLHEPFWYRLTQVVLEKRPLNGYQVLRTSLIFMWCSSHNCWGICTVFFVNVASFMLLMLCALWMCSVWWLLTKLSSTVIHIGADLQLAGFWIGDFLTCPLWHKTVWSVLHAAFKRMVPVVFEKDDDDNGHINFITAASVCLIQILFFITCSCCWPTVMLYHQCSAIAVVKLYWLMSLQTTYLCHESCYW